MIFDIKLNSKFESTKFEPSELHAQVRGFGVVRGRPNKPQRTETQRNGVQRAGADWSGINERERWKSMGCEVVGTIKDC